MKAWCLRVHQLRALFLCLLGERVLALPELDNPQPLSEPFQTRFPCRESRNAGGCKHSMVKDVNGFAKL